MLNVKAFKALRPKKEGVEDFVVPPYDVLTEEDVTEIKRNAPQSFINVIRSEVNLPQVDPQDPQVYEQSKKELERMKKEGYLVQEEEASYYIYEQQWKGGRQQGLVYIASSVDYKEGRIKRHELTLPKKEQDRKDHFRATKTQTEPVFFFSLQFTLQEDWKGDPLYDFLKDGVYHRLWKVRKPCVPEVEHTVGSLPAVYIADGHHRSASAAEVAKEYGSGIMAVLFPGNQLNILPYHRLIKKITLSEEEILQQLGENFRVEETTQPTFPKGPKEYGLVFSQKSYFITFQKKEEDVVKNLDCSILQDYVLDAIFHIQNPRTEKNLEFIGGNLTREQIQELKQSYDLILLMPATTMKDIVNVADAGKIMPPKSTWFEPKLISGLFLYPYEQ